MAVVVVATNRQPLGEATGAIVVCLQVQSPEDFSEYNAGSRDATKDT